MNQSKIVVLVALLILFQGCDLEEMEEGIPKSRIRVRGTIHSIALDKKLVRAGIFTEKEEMYKVIGFKGGNFFIVRPSECANARIGEAGFIYRSGPGGFQRHLGWKKIMKE